MDDVGSCQLACGSFVMEVVNGKQFKAAGDTIHGKVTLVLRVNVFVRGVWVKFSAVNSTCNSSEQQQHSDDSNQIKVDLLTKEDDYHCGGLHNVLVGLGEEVDQQDDHLLRMRSGTYSWPFSFTVPKHGPMSYCDDNVEVMYTLTAMLDTPALPAAMTQIVHHVIVDSIPSDIAAAIIVPKNVLRRDDDEQSMTVFQGRSPACSFFYKCDSQPLSMSVKLVEGDSIFDFQKQSSLMKLKCIVSNKKLTKKQKISINARMFVEVKSALKLDSKGVCIKYAHHKHKLWESSFDLTEEVDNNTAGYGGEVAVPIKINPSARTKCMKEWPRPTPLRHREKCILNFTTDGPLFSYKVLLLLTPSISNNKRDPTPLCDPQILEVFVRPNVTDLSTTNQASLATNAVVVIDNVQSNQPEAGCPRPVVSTPQAVLAIPKVTAEAVSFGPAAILRDRTNRNQQSFRTPSNFAQLYEIVQQPVVVLSNTPQYSPAMAHIYQTPRDQQSASHDDDDDDDDINDENMNSSNFDEAAIHSSPTCNRSFNMSVRTPSAVLGMSRRGIAETVSFEHDGDFGLTLPHEQHSDVDDIFHQPHIGRLSFAQ